ncbi:MAG: DUF2911 domain-containing protein [Chitinophagaceae bacterium]
MKKMMVVASMLLAFTAQAQIKMPAPSPAQTIVQEFGMGKIEITYSRPNLKGRSILKENSDLLQLGKMWRTGANAATKVKFTDAVTVGGNAIDSGTYVLYTIPGKDSWEIIFNKGLNNWGVDGYKKEEDVVRFSVPADKMKGSVETFTMQVANITAESCEIHLMFGTAAVKIPVTTNVKDRLRKQVETALSADKVSTNVYQAAANFYFEWDKDYAKALVNATKATEANPKAFWLFLLKAKIEKELGDKVSAKASAEKCVSLATDAKNDDYVKMGKDLIKGL